MSEEKKGTQGNSFGRDSAIDAREGLNGSPDSGYEFVQPPSKTKRRKPRLMPSTRITSKDPSPRMTSKEKKYQAYLNSQAERSADLRNDSIPLETPIALDVNTIRNMHDNIQEILSILKRNNELSLNKKNNSKRKRTRRINIRPKTANTSVKSPKTSVKSSKTSVKSSKN